MKYITVQYIIGPDKQNASYEDPVYVMFNCLWCSVVS